MRSLVRIQIRARVSSSQRPDHLWGPPSLLFNGYRGFFSPVVERPGREVNLPRLIIEAACLHGVGRRRWYTY